MQIKHSFPKLTNELLVKLEQILKEEFDYPSIPNDYKEFLLKYNGGYVSPGYIDDTDEFEHTHEIVFETPLKWVRADNKPVMPNLQSFFTVWLKEEMNEDEVEVWGLPDLVLSNEHSKYDFEVLPDNMMSIAKCGHPDSADILCLSLDDEDYGAVYYRYGMCDHPALFHGNVYQEMSDKVMEKYQVSDDFDEYDPKNKHIVNELKKAVFVKVANSFDEFLKNCRMVSVEELY